MNNSLWAFLREGFVNVGYYQRPLSSYIYLTLITLLFVLYLYILKRYKLYNPLLLAAIIALLTIFSYPFLSHDFFNYLFDAKILTFYHKNPYLHKPLDFPHDPWLRFMHWTHRSYPYGPGFLGLTLIPSFLGLGKFILNFILFKGFFALFYLSAVYCLNKMNKKWAMIFAVNPLIIVEGLISSHNDLLAVSLAIVGIYYLFKKEKVASRVFLLLSVGIKYITLPLILFSRSNKKLNLALFFGLLVILGYVSHEMGIQPWYYMSLLIFIPFFDDLIMKLSIFFMGLLFSYYPYILIGEWDQLSNTTIKNQIIYISLILNILYLSLPLWRKLVRKNYSR
jgi:hypothetical protein